MSNSPARPDELCSAAIRALSGTPNVRLRGDVLHDGERTLPVTAPHLRPGDNADVGSRRGAADGMASRLRHSDLALHQRLRPADALPGLVFDLLEQFRAEAMADEQYPGVRANLRHRFLRWTREFADAGLTETDTGLLLYTVAQVGRATVLGNPVPAEAEEIIEATRFALADRIGHALRGLRSDRADQRRYARSALAVATVIGELSARAEESDAHSGRATTGMARLFGLADTADVDDAGAASAQASSEPAGTAQEYRVFTTAYDVEESVSTAVRPAVRAEYRQRLDDRLASTNVALAPLVRELQRALAGTGTSSDWERGHEAGAVDPAQLTRLVTATGARDVFRAETELPDVSCVVTLLVDCSGSMRRHAESVAMLADVLARALERAGASCEILGFTTRGWHGGRAVADWRRAGKAAHPGRLTELRHLVVKDADTSYRRARRDIAALLKPDLYREGVAGEALRWAQRRVLARPERHRVVLFVSDGIPIDTATAQANGSRYLDDHLSDVVLRTERAGDPALAGIGANADLGRHFRHARELDVAGEVGNALLRQVLRTLAETRA
ncbi:MAG: cobalt chelatase [Actinophytocola sp.]|nr:cobalt chelatase [Actinophytocola sp.]